MMCCIFPHVKRALVFCVIFFHVWNALWYFVLYFSSCGTRSGILCYIFMRVERSLVFCVIYFPFFLFIWCCIILTLLSFNFFFPACLILPLIYALWYCGTPCYIFSACGMRSGNVLYISACEMRSGIVGFRVIFSARGMRSGILECCIIIFRVWNAIWYCGILCYIFLCVKRALVSWNFVSYFSVCRTRYGIVEFHVIFFCLRNALWYCRNFCYIFPYIESFGGDNSTYLSTCVLYFSCFIFSFCTFCVL